MTDYPISGQDLVAAALFWPVVLWGLAEIGYKLRGGEGSLYNKACDYLCEQLERRFDLDRIFWKDEGNRDYND